VIELAEPGTLFCVTVRDDTSSEAQAARFISSFQNQVSLDHTLKRLDTGSSALVVGEYLSALVLAPEHCRALALLGDGTPLSVLEIVRSVLDLGLLTPNWESWHLDVPKVAQLSLPSRTLDLIVRRTRQLAPETLALLQCAAVFGDPFELTLLSVASVQADGQAARGVAEAARAGLIERVSWDCYRFVHQSLRDALLGPLPANEVAELHARAAQAMLDTHGSDPETLSSDSIYRLAHHLSLAGASGRSELAFRFSVEAGRRAYQAFDNARALSFLGFAKELAASIGLEEHGLGITIAECQLRLGGMAESLQGFEVELNHTEDQFERAHILSRIAWIYEAEYDTQRAWEVLQKALSALGERPLGGSALGMAKLARLLISLPRVRQASFADEQERRRCELAFNLFFQGCRLASLNAQIGSVLDAAVRCVMTAGKLGPSAQLSRAYLMWAYLLTMLGRTKAAQALSEQTLEMIRQVDDPVALAHYYYTLSAVAGWQGDIERALELGAVALTKYQNWLTTSEVSLMAWNQDLLETIRGRAEKGWPWLEIAISRVLGSEGAPPVSQLLVDRAHAASIHLGRDERQAPLLARLQASRQRIPKSSGFYWLNHAERLRLHTEVFEHGPEFQALVAEFEEAGHDPRRVHLAVSAYYIVLAHARVDACYAGEDHARSAHVHALEAAASDLRRCARVDLILAHSLAIDAHLAYFKGDLGKAERSFEAANELGQREQAPWVLYAVSRGRAHLLRARGQSEAALEQARIAADLAEAHGAVHRLSRIQQEFALAQEQAALLPAALDEATKSRRHLRALLEISRASSLELDPDHQARVVLDEMIAALGAECGLLLMRDSSEGWRAPAVAPSDLNVLAMRDASRHDLSDASMIDISGVAAVLDTRDVSIVESVSAEGAPGSLIMAPLVVQEMPVGAVVMLAPSDTTSFSEQDGEVLKALVSQVPVTLELAQALRDRERLQEDLRQSQKMDAVGRLAGGIAHDFNNMLGAIRVSAETVLANGALDDNDRADLETIQLAADRAAKLTKQLLAFSRRQVFSARVLNLNQVVERVTPMLGRLLGKNIEVVTELGEALHDVKADEAQLEQVLVNLAVNARDAMPDGGTLVLRTENRSLERGAKPGLDPGPYVQLTVEDSGRGMDAETQRRVFEPFFTTKPSGAGTGLGMAMVYGIVRQSGGHVELDSELGRGTRVNILLPRTTEEAIRSTSMVVPKRTVGSGRLLLVDDEPLVRHAMERALTRRGYVVRSVGGAADALAQLEADPRVDLLITDVVMPGMNGMEMVEEMARRGLKPKVLYVSGHADGVMPLRDERDAFLQKPVAAEQLAEKVEQLLGLVESEEPAVDAS
jgi:signal transduction histidine kinase/CheY-like chemotaxis protein